MAYIFHCLAYLLVYSAESKCMLTKANKHEGKSNEINHTKTCHISTRPNNVPAKSLPSVLA